MIQQKTYAKSYENGDLAYSSNPYNKEEKEFLDRARYYYGMYCGGDCVFQYGGRHHNSSIDFKTLRDHARGMQDIMPYRDQLDPECKSENRPKPFRKWNISWRLATILSKHRDRLKSKFEKLNLEYVVTATDSDSKRIKEFLISKMKFQSDPRTQAFTEKIGYKVKGSGMTPEDIDVYNELGGIAIDPEIEMKDAIDEMLEVSKWDEINTMLIEDIIELNCRVLHVPVYNNRMYVEYVDPARYFRRYSEYPDGRDSDFKAFVKTRKISEIRNYIDDNDKLEEIAKVYKNEYQNSRFYGKRQDYDRTPGSYMGTYDEMSIDVMTFYFVDNMLQRHGAGRHSRGARVYDPIGPEVEFKQRHRREVEEVPVQYVFKCDWVVGSNFVYNYGIDNTILRKGPNGFKKAIIPIIDYIGQEPSLIERCIGYNDDIQIATFQKRNLNTKMIPGPGLIVNKSALKGSVTFGNEKVSMKENLKGMHTDGMIFAETKSEYDLPGSESDRSRMTDLFMPIPDLSYQKMQVQDHIIEINEKKILDVLGASPLEEGLVRGDVLKHTAQAITAGMNDSVAPHLQVYINGFKELCDVAREKYRYLSLNEPVVKNRRLTKDLFKKGFVGKVIIGTNDTRDLMIQDLFSKRQLIPDSAFYQIYTALNDNDLKKAQILLAKFSEKAKEAEHQRMLEQQKAAASGNAEAARVSEEERRKTMQMESVMEREKMELEHRYRMIEMREKAKLETNKQDRDNKDKYIKDVTVADKLSPVA